MPSSDLGRLSVFLSHRSEDTALAEGLANALEFASEYRLSVFLAQRLRPGQPWSPAIQKALRESHWLLVLFTDPKEEWNWCMFEAGFFVGCDGGISRPVVCLLPAHVEDPPAPLEGYQAITATREGMHHLLRSLLLDPPAPGIEPLRPSLFNEQCHEELDQHVSRIVDHINRLIGPTELRHFVPRLDLTVPASGIAELQAGIIPKEAKVRLRSNADIMFLGFTEPAEISWESFAQRLSEGGTHWTADLAECARMVARKTGQVQTMPIFQPRENEDVYRACIYSAEYHLSGALQIRVVFFAVPAFYNYAPHEPEERAFHLFCLGRRFRWQLLEQFDQRVARARRRPEEQQSCMEEYRQLVGMIRRTANLQHIFAMDDVVEAFQGSSLPQKEVEETCEGWKEVHRAVLGCADLSQGTLETRWKTFLEYRAKLKGQTNYLLRLLAQRMVEIHPLPPTAPCAEAELR